jgi:hypothetical protein
MAARKPELNLDDIKKLLKAMNSNTPKGRVLKGASNAGNKFKKTSESAMKSWYGDTPASVATNAALTVFPYGKLAKGAYKGVKAGAKLGSKGAKSSVKATTKVVKKSAAKTTKKISPKGGSTKKYNRGR